MLINLKLNINNSQLFSYGSGVKRVIRLFKEYGSREPLFEDRLGGMVVVAYRKDPFIVPLETTRLKRDGELKRVGSKKAGYWEVLDA